MSTSKAGSWIHIRIQSISRVGSRYGSGIPQKNWIFVVFSIRHNFFFQDGSGSAFFLMVDLIILIPDFDPALQIYDPDPRITCEERQNYQIDAFIFSIFFRVSTNFSAVSITRLFKLLKTFQSYPASVELFRKSHFYGFIQR